MVAMREYQMAGGKCTQQYFVWNGEYNFNSFSVLLTPSSYRT